MAASILLFGASLVVLWHIVSDIDVNELKSAFTNASLRQISLAVLFTAISYGLLTCYDAIALRQLRLQIPYRTTALASFTSYAVSFTLGFPLLTAGTVRYWIYSPKGVSPGRVASLTVIAGVTFWLGMALVLALSLISQADELASLVYTHIWMNQLVGLGAAVFVIGYMIWVSLKRRAVKIQGWKLELPGFRLSLAQILIGAGDVCAGAGVLFVLLPGGHNLSFETRSEEHTSELQSRQYLVCRLLLEKKHRPRQDPLHRPGSRPGPLRASVRRPPIEPDPALLRRPCGSLARRWPRAARYPLAAAGAGP